jgi:hypothetical protein
VNRIRRVRRTSVRTGSPPATREPHSRQLDDQESRQEPGLVSRPGRDGLTEQFTRHVAAGRERSGRAERARSQGHGLPAAHDKPCPGCCRTPSSSASTAGTTRLPSLPGSGSASTATRQCAAHGACPAGRTSTRPAITSGRSIFNTFDSANNARAGTPRRPDARPTPASSSQAELALRRGFALHRIPQPTARHLTRSGAADQVDLRPAVNVVGSIDNRS